MNTTKIIISTRSVLLCIGSVLLLLFLWQIKDVLLLLFASFVIASALFPIVDWMSLKIPRGIVVSFVYVIGFVLIATLFLPFVAVLIQESQKFAQEFPSLWERVLGIIYDWEILVESAGILPDSTQFLQGAADIGQNILSHSINFTMNFFAGLAGAFTLAVILLFLLLDKKQLTKGYLGFFPKIHRERVEEITETISKKVGGYVRGQVILMFVVGLLTFLGLLLLKVEFALLLGLMAGLFEIVPIVGPFVALVPAVIIAFTQDPLLALWVALLFLVIQRVENHFLTPFIMGKFLEMHPILIVSAILVAASTLGIFGVILSPAIAAVIYVLVQELYLKKLDEEDAEA